MASGFRTIGVAGGVACCLLLGAMSPAQETNASKAQWVERLKGLRDHKAAAFGVGPEITHLDPGLGLEIVQAAWCG